jgi:hypothetical protein
MGPRGLAKGNLAIVAAPVVNVGNRCRDALADVLALDLANESQQVHEQSGSQLKCVDPIARADQVHAVAPQDVLVDLAQVAHRAREPIQLGHGDGIHAAGLDVGAHALEGGAVGVLATEAGIHEGFDHGPVSFRTVALQLSRLCFEGHAKLGLFVRRDAHVQRDLDAAWSAGGFCRDRVAGLTRARRTVGRHGLFSVGEGPSGRCGDRF